MAKMMLNRLLVFLLAVLLIGGFFCFVPQPVSASIIFQDDFEDGDILEWNGGNVTIYAVWNVTTTEPHHGSYSYFANLTSVALARAFLYYTIGDYTAMYNRAYIRFNAVPNTTEHATSYLQSGHAGSVTGRAGVINTTDGSVHWAVYGFTSGVTTAIWNSTTTPETDIWYCMEFYVKVGETNGEYRLWIDGTEVITVTGQDNNNLANYLDFFYAGPSNVWTGSHYAVEAYMDCNYVDDDYVGMDWQGTDWPFYDTFESDNFFGWGGNATDAGDTISVENTYSHSGTFAALASTNGGGSDFAEVWKTIPNSHTVYALGYFRMETSMPDANNERTLFLKFRNSAATSICAAGFGYDTTYGKSIQLYYRNSTSWNSTYTSFDYSQSLWYGFQLYIYINDTDNTADFRVWVDSNLKLQVDDAPFNAAYLDIGTVLAGSMDVTLNTNLTAYFDCVYAYTSSRTWELIRIDLQARDAGGINLPTTVAFKGTTGNGTALDVSSDSSGAYSLYTLGGSHTINVWWSTHLIASVTDYFDHNETVYLSTRMRALEVGVNSLLFSLNNTDLVVPELIGSYDWRMIGVTASGTIPFRMDCASWVKTTVPYSFTLGSTTYTSGTGSWSFSGAIFTFNCSFSVKDFSMTWDTPEGGGDSGGGGGGGGGGSSLPPPIPGVPTEPIPLPLPPIQTLPTEISPAMNTGIAAIILFVGGTIAYGEFQRRNRSSLSLFKKHGGGLVRSKFKGDSHARYSKMKKSKTKWNKKMVR